MGVTVVDVGEFDLGHDGGLGLTIQGQAPWYLKILVTIFDLTLVLLATVGVLGILIGLEMIFF